MNAWPENIRMKNLEVKGGVASSRDSLCKIEVSRSMACL